LRGIIVAETVSRKRKNPAALAAGLDSLFCKRGNCESGNRRQIAFLLLLDLDLFVFVVIFLLASKSCFWPVNLPVRSYTSLGQSIQSKSCANQVGHGINSMI
jgi:hypothetical protein